MSFEWISLYYTLMLCDIYPSKYEPVIRETNTPLQLIEFLRSDWTVSLKKKMWSHFLGGFTVLLFLFGGRRAFSIEAVAEIIENCYPKFISRTPNATRITIRKEASGHRVKKGGGRILRFVTQSPFSPTIVIPCQRTIRRRYSIEIRNSRYETWTITSIFWLK